MERWVHMAEEAAVGNDATAAPAPAEARVVLKADCFAINGHLIV